MKPNKHWLLSLEAYYKHSSHILQYSSWAGLEPPAANWDYMVMEGDGRSYGVELDADYNVSNHRRSHQTSSQSMRGCKNHVV